MPEQLRGALAEEVPEFAAAVVRVAAEVLETMFFEEAVATACEHAWLSHGGIGASRLRWIALWRVSAECYARHRAIHRLRISGTRSRRDDRNAARRSDAGTGQHSLRRINEHVVAGVEPVAGHSGTGERRARLSRRPCIVVSACPTAWWRFLSGFEVAMVRVNGGNLAGEHKVGDRKIKGADRRRLGHCAQDAGRGAG